MGQLPRIATAEMKQGASAGGLFRLERGREISHFPPLPKLTVACFASEWANAARTERAGLACFDPGVACFKSHSGLICFLMFTT
jgi:hypothetical protein